MKKKNIELKELLIVALASILFAAGYNMFIEPAASFWEASPALPPF